MDFADVVKSRRSIRSYDSSREISDSQLRELFELVKYSPSSYNLQPWKFIVVRGSANKKRLRECANGQAHVEESSAVVIVLGSTNPAAYAGVVSADRIRKGTMDAAKKEKFDAAVKRLSSNHEKGKFWTFRSTSLAVMTLMLAAKSMGIDSCPMEGFDAARVREEFRVPSEYEVVMLVTLGYGTGSKPQPMRFGFDDIVYFEEFGQK